MLRTHWLPWTWSVSGHPGPRPPTCLCCFDISCVNNDVSTSPTQLRRRLLQKAPAGLFPVWRSTVLLPTYPLWSSNSIVATWPGLTLTVGSNVQASTRTTSEVNECCLFLRKLHNPRLWTVFWVPHHYHADMDCAWQQKRRTTIPSRPWATLKFQTRCDDLLGPRKRGFAPEWMAFQPGHISKTKAYRICTHTWYIVYVL